jgi:hypothetical protein
MQRGILNHCHRWGAGDSEESDGGREMKHFSAAEWIDFVNQLVTSNAREGMQKHLATGCKSCKETVSLWQKVSKSAAAEASYQPSADAVRLAKAAYLANRLNTPRKHSPSLVEVLFDSFRQPALAGARSVVIGTRQMLFRADPYQIDIQIEPKPGGNRIVITGQLLDLRDPGAIADHILVTVSNNRGNSVVVATNHFGEFSGELDNSGDVELSVPGADDKPVVISLRNALGNLGGGKL